MTAGFCLLTDDGQPCVGPDGFVETGRADLALVLGIVLQRGVAHPQVEHAVLPVADD